MQLVDAKSLNGRSFDIVIIGSGFGSLFYLKKILDRKSNIKVAVLEWGKFSSHGEQVERKSNSVIKPESTYKSNSEKPWNFTIGLGGGTNCWFAQSPRFHPSDFRLKTKYNIGNDWPIDYAELEPYYLEAEKIMSISGDAAMERAFPRSGAFPQPPHRFSSPDRIMAKAQPDHHFVMPTARARVSTDQRSACCATFRCNLCPVDAKFTSHNGLQHLYDNDAVTFACNAKVTELESTGNGVRSAVVESGNSRIKIFGDRFVLGANAIHSPAILHRSSMADPLTGAGLHESHGSDYEVFLEGIDNFDGSTITTGLNIGLYDGPHRAQAGGALIYFDNRWTFGLRPEKGRWRQTLPIMVVTEDLPENRNRVSVDGSGMPVIEYHGPSNYAVQGQKRAAEKLPELLSPLPVEEITFRSWRPTESHLQGTLRMGTDASNSVIDSNQVHHRYRNLTVVGSSVFPTCSSMNPSLTVAALSLRAAERA